MANTTDVAAGAAVPSSADIERASEFAREPFLLDGEGPEALAPGTARREALDHALKEIDGGASEPSIEWRRNYSLLLGLERFLATDTPTLRDGAELSPHQVDALAGTLAELMAQQQVGSAAAGDTGAGEAGIDEPETDEVEIVDDAAPEGEEEDEAPDEAEDEEPQDWAEAAPDDEDEVVEEAAEDPGAARRFWFEHATGAGKTVAAVGFIEATRTAATWSTSSSARSPTAVTRSACARRCSAIATTPKARSRSRPTSGSSATTRKSPTPTRWSSATRRTPRWARKPAPASAPGPAPSSSG